ncbi:MAG: glycosyltransferase family 2 protein [Ignavibacteriaceae bacterium]
MHNYVLITAAKNEAEFIEKTIISVINQTILPKKWVIVNDGSTDATKKIVDRFIQNYKFIELINLNKSESRSFGAKANAVMYAYNKIKDIDFEFIGNLDADIYFEPNYYENMLKLMFNYNKLGIAGGKRFDFCNGKFKILKSANNSVGGPFQFFRRECFESIKGYEPLEFGGIDALAEIKARELGWEVKSFPEYFLFHQRCTGEARNKSIYKRNIIDGKKFYKLGYHPLFFSFKFLSNIFKKPYLLGYFLNLYGFFSLLVVREEKYATPNTVKFLQQEQIKRLIKTLYLRLG